MMKAVILAGGLGTRLAEETSARPKPMVNIGGRPILWHIMKLLSEQGINEFVICLGYLGYVIKEFFANYFLHGSDVTFDMTNGQMEVHQRKTEPWKVTLVDTGSKTMTGGRIKRIADHVAGERFLMTYGDGVADVNISRLSEHHIEHGRLATVTAVRPPSRFGTLEIDGSDDVQEFSEKPPEGGGWINGGFFVLEPQVLEYIDSDSTSFEREPLERLATDRQLSAFRHGGFWQCMDTLRDVQWLENLWAAGNAPWKLWK
jgi:glucose-1-phosphate cytidylyltransferase